MYIYQKQAGKDTIEGKAVHMSGDLCRKNMRVEAGMAKYLEGVALGGVVKCPENMAQCGVMHVEGVINNGRV